MTRTYYDRLGDTLYHELLPNGLNIFVVPRRDFTGSFAFFGTNYGGVDMRFALGAQHVDSPAGVAHYLEHKMFDMPDCDVMQRFAELGASPNAFTSNAMTGYFFSTTDHFEDCLELLLRYVSTPYFTAESVQKEQGIIGQEIRMIEDEPEFRCYMELNRALFRNHPIKVPLAGSVESIAEITADTLYDCYRAFYRPNNMVLTAVGNVDPEQVIEAARRLLPAENGESVLADMGEDEPPEAVTPRTVLPMEVAVPSFLIGYKCRPPRSGREGLLDQYCAELAAAVLAGPASELYADLYAEGLIDKSFSSGYGSYRGAATLSFGGKSRDPDQVARRLAERGEALLRDGIDEAFFRRRKKAGYGAVVRALDSFENVCVTLAESFFEGINPYELPEVYDGIDADAALDFLRETLCGERRAISIITPIKGDRNDD